MGSAEIASSYMKRRRYRKHETRSSATGAIFPLAYTTRPMT